MFGDDRTVSLLDYPFAKKIPVTPGRSSYPVLVLLG